MGSPTRVQAVWLAALVTVAVVVATGGGARAQDFTWHASLGLALQTPEPGVAGSVWAGLPFSDRLFARLGFRTERKDPPAAATAVAVDLDGLYFVPLELINREWAARFPRVDPFASLGAILGPGSGIFGGVGLTYRLGPRLWGWGEMRVGDHFVVIAGLGVTW